VKMWIVGSGQSAVFLAHFHARGWRPSPRENLRRRCGRAGRLNQQPRQDDVLWRGRCARSFGECRKRCLNVPGLVWPDKRASRQVVGRYRLSLIRWISLRVFFLSGLTRPGT
jgi:hypothetical protein